MRERDICGPPMKNNSRREYVHMPYRKIYTIVALTLHTIIIKDLHNRNRYLDRVSQQIPFVFQYPWRVLYPIPSYRPSPNFDSLLTCFHYQYYYCQHHSLCHPVIHIPIQSVPWEISAMDITASHAMFIFWESMLWFVLWWITGCDREKGNSKGKCKETNVKNNRVLWMHYTYLY